MSGRTGPDEEGAAAPVEGGSLAAAPGEGGALAYLPVAVALLAEAAWIAVFAGLLQAFVLHLPVTGITELFLAAVAGWVAARTLPGRLGGAWSAASVGLAALAGLLGWLASPEVRALLVADGAGGLGPALVANPGGWLAALAFVRGMAHARLPLDPNRVGTVLAVGSLLLVLAAVVGGMISEPWRGAFLAAAQVWVLVFLAASVLALALARLGYVGQGARVDWRRNPVWLALAGSLVLGTAALAAWVALNAGQAIAMALYAVAVPLLVIGFVAGFDRRSLRILLVSLAAVGVLGIIVRVVSPNGPGATPGPGPVPPAVPDGQPDAGMGALVGIFVLVLVAAVVAVLVLVRLWLRRVPAEAPIDDEVRVIDRSGSREDPSRRRRNPRFRRRGRPADAVAAYRALLGDIDGRRPVAREPGETPAEHARRLRSAGHGGLALELLAADYGLARFGGLALTDAETRRAIGRADRLRGALLRVPVEAGEETAGAGLAATGGAGEAPVGRRGGRRGGGPGADLPDAEAPGAMSTIVARIRRGP